MATPQVHYVKDLPAATVARCVQILDRRQTPNWRELIQVMPENMYRKDDIERFAMATLKPSGSPTYALFQDLGRREVTVAELAAWIQKLPDNHQKQSLLQIMYSEAPVITREPSDVHVGVGNETTLSLGVSGHGPFQFQWFKSKVVLPGQIQATLHLQNISQHDEGFYVCRVANSNGLYVFSKWATIVVSDQAPLLPAHLCRPIINAQPQNPDVCVSLGSVLRLYCDAVGDPAPVYQWYKDDVPIPGANGREYTKRNICLDDEGLYVCVASNPSGITPSKPSCVIVVKTPGQMPLHLRGDQGDQVSDKIALLIGNQDYNHADQLGVLYHPMNDVCDLAGILSSIGFKVVSLVNLSLKEMEFALKEFYKLLDKDTYAIFYFAGHGFEVQGQSYLMPVDATNRYAPEENMRASKVLDVMQDSNAKLTIVVLDCCRTAPFRPVEVPASVSLNIKSQNVIVIFGCLPQHPVFECEAERNGYIAKHLLKHIGQPNKHVAQVILEFSRGIVQEKIIDPSTGKQQVVHRQTTMAEEMWLTAETGLGSAGAEGWKAAHEIPDTPITILQEDGLEVELLFMAEFSNVLLVTARCRPETCHVTFTMPPRVPGCTIQPLTGKEPTIPPRFCRAESGVRVADLQRLQGDLEFTLTVTTETTTRTISYKMAEKPLYAKITSSD